MGRTALGLFLLWGFCAASCGGSSSSNDGSGGSSSGDAACAALAAERCQKRDSCTNGVYVKSHFADEASCESREKTQCLASLGASGTHVTPEHFQACASAIQADACNDLLGPTPPDACLPPPGDRQNGQPCAFAGQCKSTYCNVPDGAACGSCQDLPKAGDSCALNTDCGRGLVCSTDSVCIVPATAGQDCQRDRDCAVGLACVGTTKTIPGKCATAVATVGGACDPANGSVCDNKLGLYCASTTHQCTEVDFAAAGQPCGVVTTSVVECLAGATCQIPKGTKTGTCAAAAADGAACQVSGEPHCLTPAHCVAGVDGGAGTCELLGATSC